jgi:MFS family permease
MEIENTAPSTLAAGDPKPAAAAGGETQALQELLQIAPFRNVWIASTISQLGDVCFMVALPWLVLQMTGSSLALGAVLMALAAPRALLLLVGGAISDRFPPRTILAVAFSVQAICVGAVAALIWYGALRLELLLALTVCFGIADAFTSPAMHVLLPSMVKAEQLPAANGLLESTNQICLLAGAAVVGLLIAQWGILFAFVVDAISYIFIILVMLSMAAKPRAEAPAQSVRSAIAEGLRYVWRSPDLRTILITIACVNFCVAGVTQVGFAALATFKFGSPAAFGFLLVSVGIGSVAGIVWAGTRKQKSSVLASVAMSCIVLSFLLAALAIQLPMWWACTVSFVLGIVAGYVNVLVISWLQASVQSDMLGRVMSVLEFASAGVVPVSVAIAGLLANSHVNVLFVAAGALLLLLTLLMRLRKGSAAPIEAS